MRYHNITTDDMLNGEGMRVVVWLSGCLHRCKGCQNPVTWEYGNGMEFDKAAREELYSELSKEHISGVTFSGGDPLYPSNLHQLLILMCEIKNKFPSKTIWIYTGYTWEEIQKNEIQKAIVELSDVIVDGKFIEELADTGYKWAGSTNQRVIDVVESLKRKEVVCYGGY